MVQHTSNPTGLNILFAVCPVLNVADLFVFAWINWEYPVPDSGTKILTV